MPKKIDKKKLDEMGFQKLKGVSLKDVLINVDAEKPQITDLRKCPAGNYHHVMEECHCFEKIQEELALYKKALVDVAKIRLNMRGLRATKKRVAAEVAFLLSEAKRKMPTKKPQEQHFLCDLAGGEK